MIIQSLCASDDIIADYWRTGPVIWDTINQQNKMVYVVILSQLQYLLCILPFPIRNWHNPTKNCQMIHAVLQDGGHMDGINASQCVYISHLKHGMQYDRNQWLAMQDQAASFVANCDTYISLLMRRMPVKKKKKKLSYLGYSICTFLFSRSLVPEQEIASEILLSLTLFVGY